MSNVIPTIKTVVKLSVADKAKIKANAAKYKTRKAAAVKAQNDKSVEALIAKLTANEAMTAYVRDYGKMEGMARVMAHKIADETGMRDWYTLTSANARGNERAVWDKLEELRKIVEAAAEAKGLSNKYAPWAAIKKIAKAGDPNSTKREAKALQVIQKNGLTALYKSGMREQRPTEGELSVNDQIGRLLIAAFKVDLSTLG